VNPPRRRCLLGLVAVCLAAARAHAEASRVQPHQIVVGREAREGVAGLRIQGSFQFGLNPLLREALLNGVTLPFVREVELDIGGGWFSGGRAEWTQLLLLDYLALSRRYRVTRAGAEDASSPVVFDDELQAVSAVGSLSDWWLPLPAGALGEGGGRLAGRLRFGLATERLPLPLRVRAVFDSDWQLAGEWYLFRLD